MDEFTTLLLGQISTARFTFNFICLCVGYGIFAAIYVRKGIKSRYNASPTHFDLWYWMVNNGRDTVLFLLLGYIIIRFTAELLQLMGIGEQITEYIGSGFAYIILGFGYQKIVRWARHKRYNKRN